MPDPAPVAPAAPATSAPPSSPPPARGCASGCIGASDTAGSATIVNAAG